jgi:hypothetical protein
MTLSSAVGPFLKPASLWRGSINTRFVSGNWSSSSTRTGSFSLPATAKFCENLPALVAAFVVVAQHITTSFAASLNHTFEKRRLAASMHMLAAGGAVND